MFGVETCGLSMAEQGPVFEFVNTQPLVVMVPDDFAQF
jgi:hypothetical protein